MIATILKKEVVENLLGPKFLITLAISIILVVTSVYSGYKMYESEMNWYANARSHNVERLENLGSYHRLTQAGSKVLREPSRMSIFVKGVDSAIGRSATVSRDPNTPIQDSRYGLNPIFAVFGELDLAFIVKFILSLFAFLFSYNAISGEKESGTLKQVLSYPLSKASFIFGKALGGIVILLLTLLLPILISLLMLMVVFDVNFSAPEWSRLALLTISFSLYLIVFYLVGMLMSALNRQSAVSFLMCLFIWVLSVAVVPKVSVEIAGQINQAPSIDEVEAKRAAFEREYFREVASESERALNELFAKNPRPTRQDTNDVRDKVEREAREKMDEAMNKVLDEYERKRDRLLDTARQIARISPTSCLTFAANRLSGTDANSLSRFQRNLDIYKQSYLDFAADKIAANPDSPGSGLGTSISVNEDDEGNRSWDISVTAPTEKINVSGLPLYSAEEEQVTSAASATMADMLILAVEAIVLFLAAFVAFIRYDVR